ncbi:MAG: hypothetical protein J7K85_04110 [Anaerolineaceae bacterium]|nr:hypothetical protein [Anaerolineaceae bacterium]
MSFQLRAHEADQRAVWQKFSAGGRGRVVEDAAHLIKSRKILQETNPACNWGIVSPL